MTLQRQLILSLLLALTLAISGCLSSDNPGPTQEDTATAPGPGGGTTDDDDEEDDEEEEEDSNDPTDPPNGGGGNGGNGGDDDPAPPPDDEEDDDDEGGSDDTGVGDNGNVGAPPDNGGTALKGPFAQGSTVTAVALAADGSTTGTPLQGLTDARGNFTFSDVPWDGPTIVSVSGQYFDETTGMMSTDTLTLRSALEAQDGVLRGSVNLFTHILTRYIEYWLADGWEYDDLKYFWGIPYLGEFLGFTVAPEELSFMAALEPEISQDSTLLLLYSVGFISAGLDQAALDRIAQDFAESDGWLTGEGVADFEQWLRAIQDDPEGIVAQAVERLRAEYGATVPTLFPGFVSFGQTCEFREGRQICVGREARARFVENLTLQPGSEVQYSFVPPVTGSYNIGLTPGTNLTWELTRSSANGLPVGRDFGMRDGLVREAATGLLFAGQEYVLQINGAQSEPFNTQLFVSRLSTGGDRSPVLIPSNTLHETTVGRSSFEWNNRTSYLMIRAERVGTYSIRVFGETCGANAPGVSVWVYGWQGDPYAISNDERTPFEGSALASSNPDDFDLCEGQLFEVENGAPGEFYPYLYLRIQNNAPTSSVSAFSGRNFVEIEVTPPSGGTVVPRP